MTTLREDLTDVHPGRQRMWLAFAVALTIPVFALRILSPELAHPLEALIFGCGIVGAAFIPYIDRGNVLAIRPSERKTAVVLFTLFCILGLTLTFVGIFFRGPGYAFALPWVTGLHFSL